MIRVFERNGKGGGSEIWHRAAACGGHVPVRVWPRSGRHGRQAGERKGFPNSKITGFRSLCAFCEDLSEAKVMKVGEVTKVTWESVLK